MLMAGRLWVTLKEKSYTNFCRKPFFFHNNVFSFVGALGNNMMKETRLEPLAFRSKGLPIQGK